MNGRAVDADAWKGRTLAEVCRDLGNPDLVQPAAIHGVILRDAVASVVLTYRRLGRRWFLSEEAMVVAVVPIKE